MTEIEIPYRFESEKLWWVIPNVLTSLECDNMIKRIQESNPELATNNSLFRDQDRVICDDPDWASELFSRLRPHLTVKMGAFELARLNERLRMYRYRTGQRFLPHTDHWYRPNENEITLHTVLVYLNDNFKGGETRFIEDIEATVIPKQGSVLIFQHKLRHEGCPVLQGTKFAIRTDVVYRLGAK